MPPFWRGWARRSICGRGDPAQPRSRPQIPRTGRPRQAAEGGADRRHAQAPAAGQHAAPTEPALDLASWRRADGGTARGGGRGHRRPASSPDLTSPTPTRPRSGQTWRRCMHIRNQIDTCSTDTHLLIGHYCGTAIYARCPKAHAHTTRVAHVPARGRYAGTPVCCTAGTQVQDFHFRTKRVRRAHDGLRAAKRHLGGQRHTTIRRAIERRPRSVLGGYPRRPGRCRPR